MTEFTYLLGDTYFKKQEIFRGEVGGWWILRHILFTRRLRVG